MWTRHWSFATANLVVSFETAPEDLDPADSFEFQDDIDAVNNGAVEWFCASVAVYGPNGEELARDVLGGCAYATVREFYEGHRDPDPMNRNSSIMRAKRGGNVCVCHYFPSMVREAIAAARAELRSLQSINLRAA